MVEQDVNIVGIIPAYAGSTPFEIATDSAPLGSSPHTRGAPSRTCSRRATRRDHPRIRGEHISVRYLVLEGGGIIPAYAGSTLLAELAVELAAGSSPHTRGARSPRWQS